MIELDLGDAGTGAAQIAGGCVRQQILPRAVESEMLGDLRPLQEHIPGEFMNLRMALAAPVAHHQGDVVAGVGDIAVDQKLPVDRFRHGLARGIEHALRRFGMAPDGADICFDDGERESHGVPPDPAW